MTTLLKTTSTPNMDPSTIERILNNLGYMITTGSSTIAGTSETPLVLITNPVINTFNLLLFTKKLVATTAGHTATLNIYANPTITGNGTPLTVSPLRVDTNAPATSMTAFTGPTVSANGTLIGSLFAGNQEDIDTIPLVVDPANSILLTITVSNASDKVTAQLAWVEV